MDFRQKKSDERYWNINLLNKWFAISSILFLLSFVWIFIDDNDDDFKNYQREFRAIEVEKNSSKLVEAKTEVESQLNIYKTNLQESEIILNSKNDDIQHLEAIKEELVGQFYKANMDYLAETANSDEFKYLLETARLHAHESSQDHTNHTHRDEQDKISLLEKKYNDKMIFVHQLKLNKEDLELKQNEVSKQLKLLYADYNEKKKEFDSIKKDITLIENKLKRSGNKFLNLYIYIALIAVNKLDPFITANPSLAFNPGISISAASIASLPLSNFPL